MWILYNIILLAAVGISFAQLSCRIGECGSGFCRAIGPEHKRCECEKGYMGVNCQRPCQDVFKSCERWDNENRCRWAKGRTLWFDDNCAETCNSCTPDKNIKLSIPFPPLLEPLSWLVGHWETETQSSDRYPMDTIGPYRETLIFQQSNVTMFDRPSLNITAIAQTIGDASDVHKDVGFMTAKLVIEDTGFNNEDKAVKDEVAIELNSNTGINTVEEGDLIGREIKLKTTWKKALPIMEGRLFQTASRSFKSISSTQLQETAEVTTLGGQTKTWTKYYNKVKDTLVPL